MRYWLTLVTLTNLLTFGLAQVPIQVQWLSFVLDNANNPTPIRLAPDGSLDLTNGTFVNSRFASVSANGQRVVFQVGSGEQAQIWETRLVNNQWQAARVRGNFLDINGQPQPVELIGLHPVLSGDGQHIAFASLANYGLAPNGKQQVYLLDRQQNRIVPISVLRQDTDGDGAREAPLLSQGNCVPVYVSANGRIVVFLAEFPDAVNIVDADGDGVSDNVTNPPTGWVVLAHDRDADGNGIFDELGIGATATWLVSVNAQGDPIPVGAVHVSANGRFIAFSTPTDPQNVDERWQVVVRDWQANQEIATIENAIAPSLSDDGRYLAYLTPVQQQDNDGDGQVNEDPVNGTDDDNDGFVDEDPEETYLQGTMDLVVRQLIDPQTGQPHQQPVELRLSGLQFPPSVGLADGASGFGYSDWWGAATIVVDPANANYVYVAFHSWATQLIDLQNNLVRDDDGDGQFDEDPIDGLDNDGDNAIDEDPPTTFYQGVGNIFLARFDFTQQAQNPIRLLPITPPGQRGLPVSLELVSLDPLRYRLPLAPSLMPTVSFVTGLDEDPQDNVDNDGDGQVDEDPIDGQDNDNDRTLVIVFQSLVPFDNADTNGLWDIYLVRVALQ